MKKEQLLEEFLENRIMISKIYKEYKKIIDYYDKNKGYGFYGTKIIYDFIEGNYYQLTYDDGLNYRRIEEWIKEIKEYETNDYIFELIDVDDEVILESYSAFQRYLDYCEDDFDNLAIIRDAQYMGFEDLFSKIKEEFIKFLENKKENIKNLKVFYIKGKDKNYGIFNRHLNLKKYNNSNLQFNKKIIMKELVNKFIEKYEIPENLNFLTRHYKKDDDKDWLLKKTDLINDFINENLLFDINELNKQNIEKISTFDSYIDFSDGAVNIYHEDLNKNIELFWDFIDTFGNKDKFYENLMNGQKKAYQELLENIKINFVNFLREQLD